MIQPFTPTLLAPARSLSVGYAAIQAGADAVYIGGPAYGARQAASNSVDDIAALTAYAHRFGVQVLVALNTLMTDEERRQACRLAHELYEVGVDALIVQDLRLLNEDMPPIRLHASTQCDNRMPEQVRRLYEMGFSRAVLARELSLTQIRAIHAAVPDIELEAFIHGALCVCYSGRCYLSEVLQHRSANRGCCAQLCRLPYDLLDAEGNEVTDDKGKPVHQRYLLSLQDMDRSRYIAELMDAGVTTFKIEGRLKNADYVTNVTAYYRQHIDDVLRERGLPTRTETQPIEYDFTPDPERTFHRGATNYLMTGRTRPMANWETPKSTGKPIGEVTGVQGGWIIARLLPDVTLHNGDGLVCRQQGFAVNGVQVLPDNRVRILLNTLQRADTKGTLYRNQDTAFVQNLRAKRRIAVDIRLQAGEDGFRLTYTRADNGQYATGYYAAPLQEARNAEQATETLHTQLGKLGDTPFVARYIEIPHNPTYFIPIQQLNQWRRDLTAHL